MRFRYDFAEELDLSRFQKQAKHYISIRRDVAFDLYLPDFRITIETVVPDGKNAHSVTFLIEEIKREGNGEVYRKNAVYPLRDVRFKEFTEFQAIYFNEGTCKTQFDSSSAQTTVEIICGITKILYKINKLLAFL